MDAPTVDVLENQVTLYFKTPAEAKAFEAFWDNEGEQTFLSNSDDYLQ